MLFSNHIVVHRKFVLVLISLRSFRVQHFVSIFRLLNLLQRQVTALGSNFHLLEGVGMGQRNPDAQALAGVNVIHRESVVKSEMPFVLSENRQRRKYEEERESSTQHDSILSRIAFLFQRS